MWPVLATLLTLNFEVPLAVILCVIAILMERLADISGPFAHPEPHTQFPGPFALPGPHAQYTGGSFRASREESSSLAHFEESPLRYNNPTLPADTQTLWACSSLTSLTDFSLFQGELDNFRHLQEQRFLAQASLKASQISAPTRQSCPAPIRYPFSGKCA